MTVVCEGVERCVVKEQGWMCKATVKVHMKLGMEMEVRMDV